jgi:CheY-like chemotaxis protein
VLSVKDEGIGMIPEVQSHIFEPFFTTKGGTKGTGLGLSTVYGILQQSDGHIVLQSAPGQGSNFELYFHATEAEVTRPKVLRPLGATPGDECILLVEDQDSIRTLADRVLKRAGYTVLSAETGAVARELAGRTQQIHLIVMDVLLPGERGTRVAEDLLALHPGAKLVYISGTSDHSEDSGLPAMRWFLQKPFTTEQLLSAVRNALDSPNESVAPDGPEA